LANNNWSVTLRSLSSCECDEVSRNFRANTKRSLTVNCFAFFQARDTQ